MFYAINKATKEHVIAGPFSTWPVSEWSLVEADSDGWIEWKGGAECPVPDNSEYRYQLLTGSRQTGRTPQLLTWTQVSAYRPILNTVENEVNQEWKLEVGCQAQTSGGSCEVLAIDGYRGMVAVRWHDGELGVVRIECVKKPLTERDLWIEEAERACEDVPDGDIDLIYGALYDAGLAKFPNEGDGQ